MGMKPRVEPDDLVTATVAAIERLGDVGIDTVEAGERAAALIGRYAADPARYEAANPGYGSVFHDVVALFQSVGSRESAAPMRERALPHLRNLYDARLEGLGMPTEPAPDDDGGDDPRRVDELMFCLKIFAMYGEAEDLERVAAAARRPLDPDGYLWSVVFGQLGGADDAGAVAALGAGELSGFCRVAFLDFANTRARRADAPRRRHPFDDPSGHEALRAWLASEDSDRFSYAHSATAALPFIAAAARRPLLEIAAAHPDHHVRMEAAWVRGATGDRRGVDDLIAWAGDVRYAERARAYLDELGETTAIPDATPEGRAASVMCEWLAHPQEFGRAPDEVELYDHRRLWWPPTNDERDVYLFRYRYDEPAADGVGMVGSITFALFGETTADRSAEDIYALHCCWELQMMRDPRAPAERTVDAGRALLGFSAL